jgi:hypothetical protein
LELVPEPEEEIQGVRPSNKKGYIARKKPRVASEAPRRKETKPLEQEKLISVSTALNTRKGYIKRRKPVQKEKEEEEEEEQEEEDEFYFPESNEEPRLETRKGYIKKKPQLPKPPKVVFAETQENIARQPLLPPPPTSVKFTADDVLGARDGARIIIKYLKKRNLNEMK